MAVVVNEFEVVAEPGPQPAQPGGATIQPPPRSPDLELLMSKRQQRALRVRAY